MIHWLFKGLQQLFPFHLQLIVRFFQLHELNFPFFQLNIFAMQLLSNFNHLRHHRLQFNFTICILTHLCFQILYLFFQLFNFFFTMNPFLTFVFQLFVQVSHFNVQFLDELGFFFPELPDLSFRPFILVNHFFRF